MRNDNNFKNAPSLGSFGSANLRVLRGQGMINSRDRADVYQVSVTPGTAFQVRSSLAVKGRSLNLSLYAQQPSGAIQSFGTRAINAGKGSFSLPIPEVPAAFGNASYYIKFDRPTANIQYSFRIQPFL